MPSIQDLKQKTISLACQALQQVSTLIKKINVKKIISWGTSHKKQIALAIALLYGANYALNYFFPKNNNPAVTQLVTTVVVQKSSIPIILESTGNIVAENIVDIRPQTTNVVSKINIKEGQQVKAGDLLFTLDDRADKANYEKAKALADDATRQYKRAQDLVEKKFISQAALETSQANMKSAQASARAAEVALSYDYIRAPISGRTGVINVYPGSLVQSGANVVSATTATATTTSGAMVTITQLDPINVQFTIPEKNLALLLGQRQEGDELTVELNLTGSKEAINGKVFVIDNQVDPSIGAVRVKAQLSNKEGAMIPGQYVSVKLKAKTLNDALVVPTQAVVTNINGDFLYLVKPDNTVDLNPIKVLYQYQGKTVVTGINENDKIVVEGKQNLRPGSSIKESMNAEKTQQ
jgi:membrane fusion protein, multidrug efflux system